MERTGVFIHQDYPKYKLIKDLVHHILRGCDVHYGLRCHDELFQLVLMFFRAVARWEFIPSLNLYRDQRHRRTMTNTMEGDLPNTDQDVLETRVDRGTPCIDDVRGRIRRQLETLTAPSGFTVTGTKDYQDKDNGNRNEAFLEFILPATMASDLASRTRMALASSSAM